MTELSTHYNAGLVTLSVAIAIVSAFVALAAVPRIHDHSANRSRTTLWALAFGVSLGAGIWSMHFIAMLALDLPIPVRFDLIQTLGSLLVAIGFAMLGALPLRRGGEFGMPGLVGMGILVGAGISGMHYSGMAAMRMAAVAHFEMNMVALSVLIAVLASTAALWIANKLGDQRIFSESGIKTLAAVVMGLAVSAMHYTGMVAVHFYAQPDASGPLSGLDKPLMVVALTVIATLTQGGVLLTAVLDESRAAARRELASEKRMASLLENIHDAIFSIDGKGVIQHANPAALDLFGYSAEAMQGLSVHALVPDKVREAHAGWLIDTAAGKRNDVIGRVREISAQRVDGSEFPCELSVGEFGVGSAHYFSVVVRDISARKQAEVEIEHRSRMNAGINRQLSIAILDLPLAKRLEQALACILDQAWLGISPKGAVFVRRGDALEMRSGINMGEFAQLCANVPAGECLCGKVLKTGELVLTAHVDEDHSRHSHDMKDHGHVIVPLKQQDEFLGVLNLYLDAGQSLSAPEQEFVDVSARILAQMIARDRIVNQMQTLQVAVEQTPEGVFITNTEGWIVYANPAAAAMAGMSVDQLIGRLAAEVRGGEMDDAIFRDIFSSLNRRESWRGDVTFILPDGTTRMIDRHIAPVIEGGEVKYHVCVDTDVTESRQTAAKMEHTQRLESLGVLAGGIAHDFNNILTAIMGNAALGRCELEDAAPALIHLARIEESSKRAAELCKQMLAYSGKGKFLVKAVNLSLMVEGIVKLLEVSVSKNVVLKLHLTEALPAVDADVAQLQQIIMNLVINASDAINEKSGVVSLTTGMMHADAKYLEGAFVADDIAPGEFVFLEVADTGCGMDEVTQKKVFDPFFTTKFTGRGLGMSAVLGIARGHHGAIKMYSEVGQGTTFKLLLPVSAVQASDVEESEPLGDWCGTGTILIVDDEESIREMAGMMLRRMGFDTLTAENGEHALDVYRQHQSEIIAVFLDLTMPKLDGKGCFRELRRINKDVRVILSSGYSEEDAISRFASQGLSGFIQKPYSLKDLREKMQSIFHV